MVRVLFWLVLLAVLPGMAQIPTAMGITIPKLEAPPRLEQFPGMVPSQDIASTMTKVEGFIQREPNDGAPPSEKTEVYLGYDEKNFYAVFLAFDSEPEKIRARLSPREQVFQDDYVDIQIDTFNDRRRGYTFLSTPLGIQWDALWTEGQEFDESFDAIWYSEGQRTDKGYMILFRIPFTSMRFAPSPEQTWNVLFNRSIARYKEESFWPRYTVNVEGRLNQASPMTGIQGINPGRNIRLNPYLFARNYRALNPSTATYDSDSFDPEVGLDAKMIIADSFVLDVTGNPDFSQVESDEPQVSVNERFEIAYPERRPFFLENSDFFRTFSNLVFTRRIVDPRAGIRFTGKKGPWSIGAMAIDDEAPGHRLPEDHPDADEAAQIGILRVNRDLGSKHTLGMLFTQRDFAGNSNQVSAVDGRFKLSDHWTSQAQVIHSSDDEVGSDDAYNVMFNRNGRYVSSHSHYIRTGEAFLPRLGLLNREQRPNTQNFHHESEVTFRPGGWVELWGPELEFGKVWNLDNDVYESWVNPEINIRFQNNTNFGIGYGRHNYRLSPEEFPIAHWLELDEKGLGLEFSSEIGPMFTYELEYEDGVSVNFEPAEGQAPSLGDRQLTTMVFTWRPISPLKVDGTFFYYDFNDREDGSRIFTNSVGRLRANWQFTPFWSLRLISQLDDTKVNPERTHLERERNWNNDLLIRYVLNPWTALYLGTNSNEANIEIVEGEDGSYVRPTDRDLLNTGRQYFLKCSYLFQF